MTAYPFTSPARQGRSLLSVMDGLMIAVLLLAMAALWWWPRESSDNAHLASSPSTSQVEVMQAQSPQTAVQQSRHPSSAGAAAHSGQAGNPGVGNRSGGSLTGASAATHPGGSRSPGQPVRTLPTPAQGGQPDSRPITDYPELRVADRVDIEGQPAPEIRRGVHQRRIFGKPQVQQPQRQHAEAIAPFSKARPARADSPFAYDRYGKSAIEVGLSHRLFARAAQGDHHRLQVPITTTEAVTIDLERLVHRGSATVSFIGKLEEYPDSQAILVYNEGVVGGDISIYGNADQPTRHYAFQAMEDGLTAVRELDDAAFAEEVECATCIDCEHTVGELHDEEVLFTPSNGENVVDVVVGYGRQARVADGGVAAIESRIIASVERMNISFANSLVSNTELMLLGMIEDPDYEYPGQSSGDMLEELQDLNNTGNGVLDTVSQLRSDLGADLMAFIVKDTDGSAGIAYRPGVASISARTFMANNRLTFVHELGHNFGLRHSWGDGMNNGATTISNYGWRYQSGSNKRRTVMAYDWGWDRTMYFATPDVIHPTLGVRVGAVDGYNASGDGTTDSRYVQGGLEGTYGQGFDGSNPDLGARNADYLFNNASFTAGRRTRAALAVTRPTAGSVVVMDEVNAVEWVGGVHDDPIDIQLLKGGSLVSTLASAINNHPRHYDFVPQGLERGSDYQIRLILDGGQETATSDFFTIDPYYPRVISSSLGDLGIAAPGLDQVSVTFNRAMDPASFALAADVSRFQGADGSDRLPTMSAASWSNNHTTLTISFDPLNTEGYYRLDMGPEIHDLRGFAMDQNDNAQPGEFADDFALLIRIAEGQAGGIQTILASDFESDPGFTLDGGWERGVPAQGAVGGPNAAAVGSNVLATYLSGNYSNGVEIYAVTPSFSTSGAQTIELRFQRWLGLAAEVSGPQNGRFQDQAMIAYSVAGGAWQQVWINPEGVFNDGAWQTIASTLPSAIDNQSDVRLRFGLQTNSSDSFGWNIDDLAISGDFETLYPPPPAPRVVGHAPSGSLIAAPEALWIDFDQPMASDGFSLADITDFQGPAGAITPTGFEWVTSARLRIDLPELTSDGTYNFSLAATIPNVDGSDLQSTYSGSFALGTFDPPVIVTSAVGTAHEGQAYTATLEATSPDGLDLSLSASGLPQWCSFTDVGNGSGTLSGTPPLASSGTTTITFHANDGASTTSETFSLVVNSAPLITITSPTQQELAIPSGVMLVVEGAASDDGRFGDGLVAQWSVVATPGNGQATFSSANTVGTMIDFTTDGLYQLRLSVSDGALTTNWDLDVETGVSVAGGGSEWTAQDIGSGINTAGQTTLENQIYTLSVDSGDIWNEADSFHFAWQQLSGDGAITAQVAWEESAYKWAKMGVMMRETLDPGSRHVSSLQTGGDGNRILYRTTADGSAVNDKSATRPWLRMVRSGDDFAAYSSDDGSNWTHLGTQTVAMPETIYVGLVLASHGSGDFAAATFSQVEGFGGIGNVGPLVNAGATQSVPVGSSITLDGSASDDELPSEPGQLSYQWQQLAGPTTVTISDSAVLQPTVTLDGQGEYRFRLIAADGAVKTADEVVITSTGGTQVERVIRVGLLLDFTWVMTPGPDDPTPTVEGDQEVFAPVPADTTQTLTPSPVEVN